MAESSIYKYYKELPGWGKGLVAVGALAGAVAVYYIGRNVYAAIARKNEEKKQAEAVKATETDVVALKAKGITPSYSDSQYKIWADAMEECYQGWGTCTGDTIFVNMKNDADILKLIQAFGVRTISSGQWNPAPDTTGNLSKIIRSELNSSDIESINVALAKKGITYKF